jgi:hypothetical protein
MERSSRMAQILAAIGGLAAVEAPIGDNHMGAPLFGRSTFSGRGRSRMSGEQRKVGENVTMFAGREGFFASADGVHLRRRKKLTGSCPRGYDIRR